MKLVIAVPEGYGDLLMTCTCSDVKAQHQRWPGCQGPLNLAPGHLKLLVGGPPGLPTLCGDKSILALGFTEHIFVRTFAASIPGHQMIYLAAQEKG